MTHTGFIDDSHPASRLLLGSGLLFYAVLTHAITTGVLLMIVAAWMVRMLDGHWQTTIRVLRLLRWFVIPILLLHALLSPGQLLWPDFPVAVSKEGLFQGLSLSIHLACVFAVAMLMFRLLRRREWLAYVQLLPYVGERLLIQVMIMTSMQTSITAMLQQLRMQFQLRQHWKMAPLLLISSFKRALADAGEHAQVLWLRWPQHAVLARVDEGSRYNRLLSLLWAVTGCAGFLLAWM